MGPSRGVEAPDRGVGAFLVEEVVILGEGSFRGPRTAMRGSTFFLAFDARFDKRGCAARTPAF